MLLIPEVKTRYISFFYSQMWNLLFSILTVLILKASFKDRILWFTWLIFFNVCLFKALKGFWPIFLTKQEVGLMPFEPLLNKVLIPNPDGK